MNQKWEEILFDLVKIMKESGTRDGIGSAVMWGHIATH